tara:strand:+ start:1843 stop:2235 length:393 start_codon:yes stop_codon:yes gene_type:complete
MFDEFIIRLKAVKVGPQQYEAQCPAHGGQRRNLRVAQGKSGRTLLHCHAGCDVQSIVEAVGLELWDLAPPGERIQHSAFKFVHQRPTFADTVVDIATNTGINTKRDKELLKQALLRGGETFKTIADRRER